MLFRGVEGLPSEIVTAVGIGGEDTFGEYRSPPVAGSEGDIESVAAARRAFLLDRRQLGTRGPPPVVRTVENYVNAVQRSLGRSDLLVGPGEDAKA